MRGVWRAWFCLMLPAAPLGVDPLRVDSATGWKYGCHDDQPQKFPDCRIDHICLSGGPHWGVARYTVDMSRYGGRPQFISDHRPVWTELVGNE